MEQFAAINTKLSEYATLQDMSRLMSYFDNFAKRSEFNNQQDKLKKLSRLVKASYVTKEYQERALGE